MFALLPFLLAVMPAQAEEVAAVLLMQGEAECRCAGTLRPAAVGLMLDREDTLITGEESAVILHLQNNHLVRIDEDLELSVSDIVLLDAPEISMDATAQLASLLYPDERMNMQGISDAEQIAGWHARMSAGTSPAALDESAKADEVTDEKEADSFDFESDDLMGDLLEGGEGEAFGFGGLGLSGTGVGGGGTADGISRGLGSPSGSAPGYGAGQPVPPTGLSKKDVSNLLSEEALRSCLVDWQGALPVDVKKVRMQLRVTDGFVRRVDFDQGLAAPQCARDALIGLEVTATDKQLRFNVKF